MTLVSTAWTPHLCVKFSFDVSKSSCDGHASKSSRTINVIMRAAPFCHLLEPECFVLFAVSMVCIHQQQFNCFYLNISSSAGISEDEGGWCTVGKDAEEDRQWKSWEVKVGRLLGESWLVERWEGAEMWAGRESQSRELILLSCCKCLFEWQYWAWAKKARNF